MHRCHAIKSTIQQSELLCQGAISVSRWLVGVGVLCIVKIVRRHAVSEEGDDLPATNSAASGGAFHTARAHARSLRRRWISPNGANEISRQPHCVRTRFRIAYTARRGDPAPCLAAAQTHAHSYESIIQYCTVPRLQRNHILIYFSLFRYLYRCCVLIDDLP